MTVNLKSSGVLARLRQSDLWWSFTHQRSAVFAAMLLTVLIVSAFTAPLYAPQNPFDPAQLDLWNAEIPPIWLEGGQWPYLLGTDTQGRDILSAILYGSRISILIGIASVVFALVIGIGTGLVAGYYGGFVENALMRVGDILLSIPTILIAILVSAIVRELLPPNLREIGAGAVLVLAIVLSGWVQYARTVRAQTAVERRKEYVQAAQLLKVPKAAHHVQPYPAQYADPDPCGRHAELRHGDPDRGDAVLPRHRDAAQPAEPWHADPDWQSVPVLWHVVDRALPGAATLSACRVRQPVG